MGGDILFFGEKIKALRKEKGLSQRQLGEKMGVKQQTIAQYEKATDQPKLSTVRKIAEALDVSISELVSDWRKYTPEEISADIDRDTVYKSSHRLIEVLESIEKEDGVLDQDLLKKNLPTIMEITKESGTLSAAFENAQTVKYSKEMAELLKMLNDSGKEEAIKRVRELTQLAEYQNLLYGILDHRKETE